MITPRRSYELTIIGLEWVSTIFSIPGVTVAIGFIVTWAVLGFRRALVIGAIGGIPSIIESLPNYYSLLSSSGSGLKFVSLIQSCTNLPLPIRLIHYPGAENVSCLLRANPLPDYVTSLLKLLPHSNTPVPLSLSPEIGFILTMTIASLGAALMVYTIHRRIIRIRKRLSGIYGFQTIRKRKK